MPFYYPNSDPHNHALSSMTSVYEECLSSASADSSQSPEILECIANSLQQLQQEQDANINSWFLIYAGALVFFMQAGFAMLCAGSVRRKNVQNTMLKNLLDACGAALGFFSVGYAFAFGDADASDEEKTFIGTSHFFMKDIPSYAYWLFQFAFAATAATIVAGTLAERCQMAAYLLYSILLTGFVYPVVVHAIWSPQGWLSAYTANPLWNSGMVDFAGSGVVHLTGGTTAIFATYVLGPRRGRFYDVQRGTPLKKPKPFPGHSVALQMLGTFILWFGWYGFNPGSALTLSPNSNTSTGDIAALAAVNTTLSAAAGSVVALFTSLWVTERQTGEFHFDLLMAMNGSLSGLVAITANCSVVEPWAAVVIGSVAGWLYLLGSYGLIRLKLDDAVDAIPVHFVNGLWGLIATGLFAAPSRLMATYGRDEHVGWFYSWSRGSADATLLACQLVGLLFIIAWVMTLMFPFFIWLNYKGWFRADSLEEMVGLDISYHGRSAETTDEVKLEYVEAFNHQRGLRRRNAGRRSVRGSIQQNNTDEAEEQAAEQNEEEQL